MQIKIKVPPSNTGKEVRPVLEIKDGVNFEMIWTNNPNFKGKNKEIDMVQPSVIQSTSYKIGQASEITIKIVDPRGNPKNPNGKLVFGDLYFRLINGKNNSLICRFAMNTSFVPDSNVYTFDKAGVDPDSILNNKKFDPNFRVELHFKDECQNPQCSPKNPLTNLCDPCRAKMPNEFREWNLIKDIVDKHSIDMINMARDNDRLKNPNAARIFPNDDNFKKK